MLFLGNSILGKSVNVILSKNSRGLGASQRADVFSLCYSARARETIMRPLICVIAPSPQYLIRSLYPNLHSGRKSSND